MSYCGIMNEYWLTGFWEADGSVTIYPHKHKDSPSGFYWRCYFSITQAENAKDVLYKMKDYLRSVGIRSFFSLCAKGTESCQTKYRICIKNTDDVVKFINLIKPHIETEKRVKQIELAEKAAKIIQYKEHLLESGFNKLIDIMDECREYRNLSSKTNAKYSREYFEKLWSERGGFYAFKPKRNRISKREWDTILKMREEGCTLKQIGEKYGVKLQSIDYILKKIKKGG